MCGNWILCCRMILSGQGWRQPQRYCSHIIMHWIWWSCTLHMHLPCKICRQTQKITKNKDVKRERKMGRASYWSLCYVVVAGWDMGVRAVVRMRYVLNNLCCCRTSSTDTRTNTPAIHIVFLLFCVLWLPIMRQLNIYFVSNLMSP